MSEFKIFTMVFIYLNNSRAISDPSIRLMFVGLASRGKSTLLNHLRWVDRMNRIPVGWRERMCQDNCGKMDQPGSLAVMSGLCFHYQCGITTT